MKALRAAFDRGWQRVEHNRRSLEQSSFGLGVCTFHCAADIAHQLDAVRHFFLWSRADVDVSSGSEWNLASLVAPDILKEILAATGDISGITLETFAGQ